jgi:hypothetical protein
MTEPYIVWAVIAGFTIGAAAVWFAVGRLPRRTDDISPVERANEGAWIRSALGDRGRRLPEGVVEEVLELHDEYVARSAP